MDSSLFKSSLQRNIAILRNFLFIFTITSLFVISITSIIYYIQKNSAVKLLLNREKSDVISVKNEIVNKLNDVVSDLFVLAENVELTNLTNSGNKEYVKKVEIAYESFSSWKKKYDQIRFINKDGAELIRVDLHGDSSVIVPQINLQNKKDRYYFIETLKLKLHDVYMSPFDLNIEKGKIEQPIKPMIRFATPVFDKNNEKMGMVIVNYLGQIILERIEELDGQCFGDLMLINSDGYWLKGKTVNDAWGFMYPDRKDVSFSNHYPDEWESFYQKKSGQINIYDRIFTFNMIETEEIFSENIKSGLDNNWYAVSMIEEEKLNKQFESMMERYILFDLIILFIIALGSLFISRANIRHKEQELSLIEKAKFKTAMEMAGAMSHELNQPLQIISGYAQLLSNEVSDKKQKEKLSMINSQLDRIIRITRKLLHITKYETKEYVDGSQIIDIDKSSEEEKNAV